MNLNYAYTPQPVHNAFCEDLVESDIESYTKKGLDPPEGLRSSLMLMYKSKPLTGQGGLVGISLIRKQQDF